VSAGDSHVLSVLLPALQIAVPLIVADLATLEPDERERKIHTHSWRAAAIEAIGSHGDELLYGGKNCASTFHHLASALAALSHTPGGVTVFRVNWCAEHHPGGRTADDAQPCEKCNSSDILPFPEPRPIEDVQLPDVIR
jgi:hypothetical protein